MKSNKEVSMRIIVFVVLFSVIMVYLLLYVQTSSIDRRYPEGWQSRDYGCAYIAVKLEFQGRIIKITRTRDAGRDDTLHISCNYINLPDVTIYPCSSIDVDLDTKMIKYCVSKGLVRGGTVDGRKYQAKVGDFIIMDQQGPFRMFSSATLHIMCHIGVEDNMSFMRIVLLTFDLAKVR